MQQPIPQAYATAIKAEAAKRDLKRFVKEFWHVNEPNTPFISGIHIDALTDHLTHIDEIGNLLICEPPGFAKSLMLCLFFCHRWLHHPHERFIFASHSIELSTRDSLRCRRILDSELFQSYYGHLFKMMADQDRKTRFENDKTGFRLATSVDSGVTGERADFVCLPGEAKIWTEQGDVSIADLVNKQLSVRVACLDHNTNQLCWRRILQTYRTTGRTQLYRVSTSRRQLLLTGNHPIFIIGRGYQSASTLTPGEQVYGRNMPSVQEDLYNEGRSSTHEEIQASLLLNRMSVGMDTQQWREPGSAVEADSDLCHLLQQLYAQCNDNEDAEDDVFQEMPASAPAAELGNEKQDKDPVLSDLWQSNPGMSMATEEALQSVLFKTMCGPRASWGTLWRKEWSLGSWQTREAIPLNIQQRTEAAGDSARRWLFGLSSECRGTSQVVQGEHPCTSHRLRQNAQRDEQSCCHLQEMSWKYARQLGEPGQVASETIVSVERVHEVDTVYNLEVEEHQNYFAEGILVHNCCDDPHNIRDVDSKAKREAVINWYATAFSNRTVPQKSQRIIVMQMSHAEDLANTIIKNDKENAWTKLIIPLEAGRSRYFSTRWVDPRNDGELLCPELFSQAKAEEQKRLHGTRAYKAQYNQNPAPPEDALFNPDNLQYYRDLPEGGMRIAAVDLAISGKGDYSVVTVADIHRNGQIYVVHIHRERTPAARIVPVIQAVYTEYKPAIVYIEDVSFQAVVIQQCRAAGLPVRNFKVGTTGKETRALPLEIKVANQQVYLPEGRDFNKHVVEELSEFPHGQFDDCVDSLSMLAAEGNLLASRVPVKQAELTPEEVQRQREERQKEDEELRKRRMKEDEQRWKQAFFEGL